MQVLLKHIVTSNLEGAPPLNSSSHIRSLQMLTCSKQSTLWQLQLELFSTRVVREVHMGSFNVPIAALLSLFTLAVLRAKSVIHSHLNCYFSTSALHAVVAQFHLHSSYGSVHILARLYQKQIWKAIPPKILWCLSNLN